MSPVPPHVVETERVHGPLTLSENRTWPGTSNWLNHPTSRSPAATGSVRVRLYDERRPAGEAATPWTNSGDTAGVERPGRMSKVRSGGYAPTAMPTRRRGSRGSGGPTPRRCRARPPRQRVRTSRRGRRGAGGERGRGGARSAPRHRSPPGGAGPATARRARRAPDCVRGCARGRAGPRPRPPARRLDEVDVRLAGEKGRRARPPGRAGACAAPLRGEAVIAAVHGREMEVHLPGLRGGRRPVERHLRGAGSATARARRRKLAGYGSSACTPRGPDRARERERVQTQVCADVD